MKASGWGWVLLIGVILLPLSPVLALIGMFLFALLHDKILVLYAEWKVSMSQNYLETLENEIQRQKENEERTD